jgi:phosphoribosylformylglycinamidine cyclo-ligase
VTPDGRGSPHTRHGGYTYESAGVAALEGRAGFRALLAQLGQTLDLRSPGGAHGGTGRSLLDFGAYASVLDIGGPMALAISTDGVGTKAIVAQLMDRYDTVGIDCVAMNVNDVLCVGAEPISMVDYIAVEGGSFPEGDRLLEELGKGLLEGARQAEISIPGGEISQMKEVISAAADPGYGFDLAGTCVGLVDRDRIIAGQSVAPGQAIVGLASSGIHSNGLTLAREVLLRGGDRRPSAAGRQQTADSRPEGAPPRRTGAATGSARPRTPRRASVWTGEGPGVRVLLDARPAELGGRTVGEELLEPTRIYVKSVMPMLREARLPDGQELPITALAHITSGGFMNLTRVRPRGGPSGPVAVGFEITWLPEPPGIFELIRRSGPVSDEEMYRVYNMGIGFCVVCAPEAVSRVIEHAKAAGVEAWEIGRVAEDARGRVWLRERGLVGENGVFSADG